MDALTQQIIDLLKEQEAQYHLLRRILARQTTLIQRDDVGGVEAATAEIRQAMEHLRGLGARLFPFIERWRERPLEKDDPVSERAGAVSALVAELQDLRARNEERIKGMLERRRQDLVSLNTGARALRGYVPRHAESARFVDRMR